MTLKEFVDRFNRMPDTLATYGPLEVLVNGKPITNIRLVYTPNLESQIHPKIDLIMEEGLTEEDTELLVKDLMARLPYGVKVKDGCHEIANLNEYASDNESLIDYIRTNAKTIKPYLRPLESLTKEEKEEYDKFFTLLTAEKVNFGKWLLPANDFALIDWCNAHHVDYRGMIPKGLAISTKEGINPYLKKQ